MFGPTLYTDTKKNLNPTTKVFVSLPDAEKYAKEIRSYYFAAYADDKGKFEFYGYAVPK